jgi:hypothetical protein
MEFSISHTDGNVIMTSPTLTSIMTPNDARELARRLLAAAEVAQVVRSRRGDGLPERITLDEIRGLG